MNLNRLDTEVISYFQHQMTGNNGHQGLTRSQVDPVSKLPLGIHDIPNLIPPVRSPAHPQDITRPAQEIEQQRVVSRKVYGSPRFLSQRLEYPLSEDFLRDGVLEPVFPVLCSDLETVVKRQRHHRFRGAVEAQNPYF